MGFKEICPGVPKNTVRDAKCLGGGGVSQVLKIRHLTTHASILTFPRYQKTSVGVGQPSTSHCWEGTEERD